MTVDHVERAAGASVPAPGPSPPGELPAGAEATRAGEVFDWLSALPLERFGAAERLLFVAERLLTSGAADRLWRQHAPAMIAREEAQARARGDRLGEYLTPEATAALLDHLGRPVTLDPATWEAIVRQEAVRTLLRTVVEETITWFVQALRPGATEGGLLGPLGGGLLGRLSGQIEAQLQRTAGAFVGATLERLLGRVAQLLSGPEMAKQLGRLRRAALQAALSLPAATVIHAARALPISEWLALGPEVVRHNLGRQPIRQAILVHLREYLAEEGARPLAELLGDPASVAGLRQAFVDQVSELLAERARSGPSR